VRAGRCCGTFSIRQQRGHSSLPPAAVIDNRRNTLARRAFAIHGRSSVKEKVRQRRSGRRFAGELWR